MGTICLYETPGTNWSGSGGLYDLICEYALNHPRVQALPEFAQALQDSLWYKDICLYEHGEAAIRAFTEAVGELLEYVASPEGEARWGERRPIVLKYVQMLYPHSAPPSLQDVISLCPQ